MKFSSDEEPAGSNHITAVPGGAEDNVLLGMRSVYTTLGACPSRQDLIGVPVKEARWG